MSCSRRMFLSLPLVRGGRQHRRRSSSAPVADHGGAVFSVACKPMELQLLVFGLTARNCTPNTLKAVTAAALAAPLSMQCKPSHATPCYSPDLDSFTGYTEDSTVSRLFKCVCE